MIRDAFFGIYRKHVQHERMRCNRNYKYDYIWKGDYL